MTRLELLANEYRENKRLIEELTKENDKLKIEIIELMDGLDSVIIGACKITNKEVTSNRFDSKAFKKDYEKLYNQYIKQNTSKRFLIS